MKLLIGFGNMQVKYHQMKASQQFYPLKLVKCILYGKGKVFLVQAVEAFRVARG
jgi:hypothetical protein